jgi:hypothetical protein
MTLDPFDAELLPLSKAAKSLGPDRNGKKMAPSTLWRWASKGLHGEKLQIIRRGGIAFTSRTALADFFARVEAARTPGVVRRQPEEPPAPTAAIAAGEGLRAHGI